MCGKFKAMMDISEYASVITGLELKSQTTV
jgi:hypothetical protein